MRRAIIRGETTVNPTLGLELRAVRGRRDRVAPREEAPALLAALDDDRALAAGALAGRGDGRRATRRPRARGRLHPRSVTSSSD